MSDFERRLTEALAVRAAAVPETRGLAERARLRHRRRRATAYAGTAALVVAAAVAVPLVAGMLRVDEPGGVAGQPEPTVTGVPAGWRFESYRDVEFAVPEEWGYGVLSQYCISDGRPVVQRPNMASTLVACPRAHGYGVVVSPPEDAPVVSDPAAFPAGAAVHATTVAGVTVTAITRSPAVADDVVESAHEITGLDFHGCDPRSAVPPLGEMSSTGGSFPRDAQVTVCRYDVGVEGANLVASESLVDPADGGRLWEGVDALVPGSGPDPEPDSCLPDAETEAVLFRIAGQDWMWVHYSGCTAHGVDLGGDVFALNQDIVWAALGVSWSGGVGGEVPMPREGRFVTE